MEMLINLKIIKRERAKRAWSQQHLAEVADLSLRTVQRIESIGTGSFESIKAIAAAFDLEPESLLQIEEKGETKKTVELQQNFKNKYKFIGISASTLLIIALPVVFYIGHYVEGSSEFYRFEGGIRIDDGQPHFFGLDINDGQVFILDIDNSHKLLFDVQSDTITEEATRVRLLKANGTSYNVLHTSIRPGPNNQLHSLSYRVCGENISYHGPALDTIPDCNVNISSVKTDIRIDYYCYYENKQYSPGAPIEISNQISKLTQQCEILDGEAHWKVISTEQI